jgi:TRAP-type mannitol/chloroaromatic compound transport system permease small subunit
MNGLKYRTVGLAADVLLEMGMSVVQLPGGEIQPAMKSGLIDAAEFNNPTSDRDFGMQDVSKHYHLASFHQSQECFEVTFNKDKFNALAPEHQAIIRNASMAENSGFYWNNTKRYSDDLIKLQEQDGVNVYRTPDSVMAAQLEAWDVGANRIAEEDPFFAKVMESQKAYAKNVMGYLNLNQPDYSWPTTTTSVDRSLRNARCPGVAAAIPGQLVLEGCPRNIQAICWGKQADEICSRHGGPEPLGRSRLWMVHPDPDALGSYEVFVRYVLNAPTVWAFDMMIQMYGALFLMCGAYALAQDTHVRADVIYRLFPVKVQASLDFVLYFLFFFPGILALVWYGWEIASDSWRYKEVSFNSPASIQIYFFKTLIPVSGRLAHDPGNGRAGALRHGNAHGRLAGAAC